MPVGTLPPWCRHYNHLQDLMVRLAILLGILCPVLYSQTPASAKSEAIEISGAVEATVRMNAAQLAGLPQKTVTLKQKDGQTVSFQGAPLGAVLQAAGVLMGDGLRGNRLTGFVLVEGADGYRAVFSLPETDAAFTDDPVLIAIKRDGKTLPNGEGPFRVIVPKEKKQSRWIRQVVAIRVLRAGDALEE